MPGTMVALIGQSETSPEIGSAQIVERLGAPCKANFGVGVELGRSVTFYRVDRVSGAVPDLGVSYAIASSLGPILVRAGKVEGDLDGDGTPEMFRTCTSAEGVHFTVWSGPPFAGTARWHGYYYVG